MKKNAVSWFEIPVREFERAKSFYEMIYRYEMPEMPVGDTLLGILPYDSEGGGVGGAIISSKTAVPSAEGTLVYLDGGDNLDEILTRVEPAGGRIELAKTAIGEEMGYYAVFIDTEGNRIGVWSKE